MTSYIKDIRMSSNSNVDRGGINYDPCMTGHLLVDFYGYCSVSMNRTKKVVYYN